MYRREETSEFNSASLQKEIDKFYTKRSDPRVSSLLEDFYSPQLLVFPLDGFKVDISDLTYHGRLYLHNTEEENHLYLSRSWGCCHPLSAFVMSEWDNWWNLEEGEDRGEAKLKVWNLMEQKFNSSNMTWDYCKIEPHRKRALEDTHSECSCKRQKRRRKGM